MKHVAMVFLGLLVVLMGTTQSFAVPALQLDIKDGIYVPSGDLGDPGTTFATTTPFTLYALLDPSKVSSSAAAGDFFLSIALVPKVNTAGDLGSFTFDYLGASQTINVTGDMIYGTPPVETLASPVNATTDPGDLQSHGIFETFFTEYKFNFDPSITTPAYDVQTDTPASGNLYVREFEIDVTNLDPSHHIHFDLYSEMLAKDSTTDLDRDLFAPFSHDAESDGHQLPEPGTMILLGSGLVGLAGLGRKKIRK